MRKKYKEIPGKLPCYDCKKQKPDDQFHRDTKRPFCVQSRRSRTIRCKACVKEMHKRYDMSKKTREWQEKNWDKFIEYQTWYSRTKLRHKKGLPLNYYGNYCRVPSELREEIGRLFDDAPVLQRRLED